MEFNRVTDLYSDPDSKGHQRLIKKNVLLKVQLELDDISRIEQVIGSKNIPHKTKCLIYWGTQNTPILVQCSYTELVKLKEESLVQNKHKTQVGFKYKNKK